MKRTGFTFVELLLAVAIVAFVAASVAMADQFTRTKIAGTVSATVTNNADFFNAKILAVRAYNMAGAAVTNTITVSQVTADGAITNTIATFTTATSGSADVSTNGLIQLKGDMIKVAASSNFLVEVVLDDRSR